MNKLISILLLTGFILLPNCRKPADRIETKQENTKMT